MVPGEAWDPKAVHSLSMSTPPPNLPKPSGAVAVFVPGYLVVFGLVLLAGSVYLAANYGDELFVAGLAAVGGLTMVLTAVLLMTIGGRGAR
jgi:hypothetical protein